MDGQEGNIETLKMPKNARADESDTNRGDVEHHDHNAVSRQVIELLRDGGVSGMKDSAPQPRVTADKKVCPPQRSIHISNLKVDRFSIFAGTSPTITLL